MKKLLDGVIKFKNDYFEKNKDIFNDLATSQKPHTLFIGCSDSRVIPDIITSSKPGDLFVVRNIANMVPIYNPDYKHYHCTTSVIEYAVEFLEVENIIVCGHSNCGGCKALYYDDEKLSKLPYVKQWLKLGQKIKDRVLNKNLKDFKEIEFQTEQLNVVAQLEHLLTYPFIQKRVNENKLKLFGWYFVIERGDIFNYNFEKKEFELINENK